MPSLATLTDYLDRTLNLAAFEDVSHNGLQVANGGKIRRVAAGVDASMAFFERAAERGADLLICHHGLSWGDSLKRITGLNYRRLKFLLDRGMALYACHLPLDAHPRLGNNARICRALGLQRLKPFGCYHGVDLGFRGVLPSAEPIAAFQARAARVFGREPSAMAFGKDRVRTVAVVSGGAAELVEEAAEAGADVFVSGEPKLVAWHLAQEHGIHALFAGHYATEVFGVQAVAAHLARRFSVAADFIPVDVPY